MAFTTTAGSAEYVSSGYAGVRGLYTTKRKYSLSDKIVYQDPHLGKIHTLLRDKMSTITVTDPEPKVLTKREVPRSFTCQADQTAADDISYQKDRLRMSDTLAKWLQAGDRLECANIFCSTDGASTEYTTTKFASGYMPETVIVTSVDLSGISSGVAAVLVRRGNGHAPAIGSTVQTVLSEYKWLHIGNALEDGGDAPTPKWHEPNEEQNFCQLFSKTWGETETEGNTDVYGKEPMPVKAMIARQKLIEEIDYDFLFGRKKRDTVNGQSRWWTGGMVEYIPSSTTALDGVARHIDFGGAYDRDIMREKAEIIYRYGSEVKHWFIGRKLWTVMMNADEKFITMNDKLTKQFGWQVYEYDFGHGLAILHTHRAFREKDSTITPYAYDAAILDLNYIDLMVMKNMDLKVKQSVQDDDEHGQIDELYGQIGLYRSFPSAHAYIYGITG